MGEDHLAAVLSLCVVFVFVYVFPPIIRFGAAGRRGRVLFTAGVGLMMNSKAGVLLGSRPLRNF